MPFQIVPQETSIGFTKIRNLTQSISAILVVAALVATFTLGLNFGIDFRGGVTVEVGPAEGETFEASDLSSVRDAVGGLGLGDVRVQNIGGGVGSQQAEGIVVFVEAQDVTEAVQAEETPEELAADALDPERAAERAQQQVADEIRGALTATLGEDIAFRRVDVVGPTVSGELVERGAIGLGIAVLGMLIYIWISFEWQFSVGAIVALVHDVILTVGMFAVTQLDFTLSIVAALLTIIGYSMNDTVVVFDRIRENLRRFKKRPLEEVVDLSLNQTLSRTLMTSLTTLLALVALFVFGGQVLRGFSWALIWGILIGTYSSVFIASPMLLRTGVPRGDETAATPATAQQTP